MSDIFLSYDGRDLEKARVLASALSALGLTVFFDRTIPPGQTWRQFIGKEIDECRCMVVAWSTHSISSHWVCEEADIGLKRNILIPVLFDQVMPPLGFASLQAASLVDWQGETDSFGYLALTKAVMNSIGPGKSPIFKVEKEPNSSSNAVKTKPPPRHESNAELQNSQVDEQANGTNKTSSVRQPDKKKKGYFFWIGTYVILITVAIFIVIELRTLGQEDSIENKVNTLENLPMQESQVKQTSTTPTPANNQTQFLEPDMVRIPAGSFQMGSNSGRNDEKPIHIVRLKGFSMGRYEVTFDEFDLFAKAISRKLPSDQGWGRGDRPVIVSLDDAQAYANWLSDKTGKLYRLPSEAEWEYAARAKTTSKYYWGDKENVAEDYAWFSKNSKDKTHPVGQKKPNKFGLYDMSGNIWEWVQDCWHGSYDHAPTDGSPWLVQNGGDCSLRVLRGGSWSDYPWTLRSAARNGYYPGSRSYFNGFRLAQD